MAAPRLTFFVELEVDRLLDLFDDSLISDLVDMRAGISMGMLDYDLRRAEVGRRLNQAGIPVTAWLLLPRDQGYWFNLENSALALERYQAFREWTQSSGLQWEAVGLDIEPDIRDMEQLQSGRLQLLRKLPGRVFGRRGLRTARQNYRTLVSRIRADGWRVESYQHPFIVDERRARSTLLQRVTGMVDVPVDREVLMLYSSIYRPHGAGLLWSYASEAQGIGLGITGGGITPAVGDPQPLTWDELDRDLRLAWYWSDHLYIFSLEGCVQQGFLPRLKEFVWDKPILIPEVSVERVARWRAALASLLWVSAHFQWLLASAAASFVLVRLLRRFLRGQRAEAS